MSCDIQEMDSLKIDMAVDPRKCETSTISYTFEYLKLTWAGVTEPKFFSVLSAQSKTDQSTFGFTMWIKSDKNMAKFTHFDCLKTECVGFYFSVLQEGEMNG